MVIEETVAEPTLIEEVVVEVYEPGVPTEVEEDAPLTTDDTSVEPEAEAAPSPAVIVTEVRSLC